MHFDIMEVKTFKKGSGTSDLGKPYEDINVCNLVLKMVDDDSIDNFNISSYDDDYASFDDIVVEKISDNSTVFYALQLKHVENDKTLKIDNFKEGKDFEISKYFKAYKKINPSNSYQLILFTNRKFDYPNGTEIQFEKQQFSVELIQRKVDPLINTAKGVCYQFVNLKNMGTSKLSDEQQDYIKFFKSFFLYTNQANFQQLENSVSRDLQDKFSCQNDEFSKYQRFISQWSLVKGNKNMLNKFQMKKVIAFCVLSKFIKPMSFGSVNKKTKNLRKVISRFDVTVVKRRSYELVKRIWGDTRADIADKIKEINVNKNRYPLNMKHINNIEDIDDTNCSKLLWIMGYCPLIVLSNDCTFKIIKLCTNEKFIVLGHVEEEYENELQNRSVFQNLADLSSSEEAFIDMTTKLKYSIQGKGKTSLQCLVKENEAFAEKITTDDLLKMLTTTIIIGGEKEKLPSPYIDRQLTRNIIDYKYLREIDKNTIIVIDSIRGNNEFKNRVRNFNLIDIDEYLSLNKDDNLKFDETSLVPNLYVKETQCLSDEFMQIYEINSNATRGHHFSLTVDGHLEWVYSESSTKDLKPFLQEKGSTSEIDLCCIKNKINLVVGEPGMGKSVLMKNIKNNFSSTMWTVVFDTDDIKKMSSKNFEANTFENFLLTEKYPNLGNFEKKVLQILMEKNQVVYIWDAIDEIDAKDFERIVKVMLKLSEQKINQWVTCRYYLKNSLERKFNILSKKIIQFSEEEQSHYIRKRLHTENNDLTPKIKNLIVNNEILGIPLQIFMLTELFRENPEHYSKLSNDIFNVTDLYFYFVKEKFNIFFNRKGVNAEDVRGRLENNICEEYEMVSLKALVPSLLKEPDKCNQFLQNIQKKTDPVGIITEVTSDNVPHFIHKSFAEYFVAVHFVKNFPKELGNSFFDNTLRNVRFFFDLLMAKDSSAHVAVMYKNVETLRKFGDTIKTCKDLGDRNLLQLACSWGQEYPKFKVYTDNDGFILDTGIEKNYLVSQEDPSYVEMLRFLLVKCNVTEKDQLFKYDALTYASKTNSLFAQTKILQQQKKTFVAFRGDDCMASVLYYAAKFGYVDFINLYKDFPFIKIHNNGTYLHLSVSQEKVVEKLLRIPVYLKNIDARDANGVTALSKACQSGQTEVVHQLLSNHAGINIRCKNGRIPLHYACQFGHDKIVLRLIQIGTDVNVKDKKDYTPLHFACLNGHKNVVELLVKHKADVNQADAQGWTPLHSACINGHDHIIELLKNSMVDIDISKIVNIPKDIDWTPLHSACWHGHTKVVQILIQFDADVNRATKDGRAPLHYACEKGYESVIEVLCENGAKANVMSDKGWTPLHLACSNGHCNAVKMLLKFASTETGDEQQSEKLLVNTPGKGGCTPLHIAAIKGDTRSLNVLLDNNAAINATDEHGRTPLHWASHNGQDQTVRTLIDRNCEVNPRDTKHLTPLHLSCMKKPSKVVKILTENSADVDAKSKKLQTPLHFACQLGHHQTVNVLLKCNPDVTAKDNEDVSPLHVACFNGHIKIVKELIKISKIQKNINMTTRDNYTSLHYACLKGYKNIVKKLLNLGADFQKAATLDLKTPFYSACFNGHNEVVKLLINKGVDINAATKTQSTPLHAASENNHFEIAWNLINEKAKIDAKDETNCTPLHIACNKRHYEIVRLLISSGCNINAATNEGSTPLHLTCINKDKKMCQYIIDCADRFYVHIDFNALDAENKTPLYMACEHQQKEIFDLLVERSAKIFPENNWFPLHYACYLGEERIVNFLLQSEDVNVQDFNNWSPLHYACQKGYYPIVKLLVQHKANVDVKDLGGQTPLHLASEKDHFQVVQLLIQHNVDVNTKDRDGKTPLHNACQNGHIKVVKLLINAGSNVKARTDFKATPLDLASRNQHYDVVKFIRTYFKKYTCCAIPWMQKKNKINN